MKSTMMIGDSTNRAKKIRIAIFLIVITALTTAFPAGAWFYYEREIGGVAEINAPISLYIHAGAEEDIVYLNLSNIDVENGKSFDDGINNGKYYQDFVFYISGEGIENYRIQLAYTTNNQFDYWVYKAEDANENDALVKYTDHRTEPGTDHYYKIKSGTDKIEWVFLNKASDWLAKTDDKYKTDTYGNYNYINKYAYPIYKKSDESANLEGNGTGFFHDKYILRVVWDEQRKNIGNNKETDIIYIAARVR